MPGELEEENVFGTADASSYSAVLCRTPQGRYTVQSLLIDGHNVPVRDASWATREEAIDALKEYAKGDRQP
ncbi:hypothetical protein GmRootA79_18480 [Acidovorax sp. A79]|uniref:hypothetical protein n=1 Tax=Acidovorax sp. A79 TaxID=3056107 RepID=UPI0034E85FED